jgi:hypothetical protein
MARGVRCDVHKYRVLCQTEERSPELGDQYADKKLKEKLEDLWHTSLRESDSKVL